MVNTEKVVGFYVDVFGNEVDEYEQVHKYTVWYNACIFEGDKESGWNSADFDRWEDAHSFYSQFDLGSQDLYIMDNEYGCVFTNNEW